MDSKKQKILRTNQVRGNSYCSAAVLQCCSAAVLQCKVLFSREERWRRNTIRRIFPVRLNERSHYQVVRAETCKAIILLTLTQIVHHHGGPLDCQRLLLRGGNSERREPVRRYLHQLQSDLSDRDALRVHWSVPHRKVVALPGWPGL